MSFDRIHIIIALFLVDVTTLIILSGDMNAVVAWSERVNKDQSIRKDNENATSGHTTSSSKQAPQMEYA
jgi:hypothetical protein